MKSGFTSDTASSQTDQIHQTRQTHQKWKTTFARLSVPILAALFCAAGIISLANDMYAFVKPEQTVTLTVSSPLSLSELSREMASAGVIRNPTVFRLYVRAKNRTDRLESYTGVLTLNSAMSYREILQEFFT